jgi:hypothetical protein
VSEQRSAATQTAGLFTRLGGVSGPGVKAPGEHASERINVRERAAERGNADSGPDHAAGLQDSGEAARINAIA